MVKKIEKMDNYERSRWYALLKAIDTIDETCEILNKKFEDIELKPVALKHYIKSLSTKIQGDLDRLDKDAEAQKAKFAPLFCEIAKTASANQRYGA